MTSVVKKILRGRQRVETDRIIAFRSHWGYRSEYCNPAKGNEKGGVEGELGWYRRNCLVPVPEAKDLATLNEHLLAACVANRGRTISGKSMTVGEASQYERASLLPPVEEGFPLHEILYPLLVDGHGRVKVIAQLVLRAFVSRVARDRGGGTILDRDQTRPPVRGSTPAMLWTRPSDSEPRSLLGRARCDGGLNAPAAMATGGPLARPLARMLGPNLGSTVNV